MKDYDPRYLAGILFFNEQDYFEAHEVWEDLWSESYGDEHAFYQGLIQAAVGLFHFHSGNLGGARKLYRSSRDYMEPCGSPFLGLDVVGFWQQMERCFQPLLDAPESSTAVADQSLCPAPEHLPTIILDPPPENWPDLADYNMEEE